MAEIGVNSEKSFSSLPRLRWLLKKLEEERLFSGSSSPFSLLDFGSSSNRNQTLPRTNTLYDSKSGSFPTMRVMLITKIAD